MELDGSWYADVTGPITGVQPLLENRHVTSSKPSHFRDDCETTGFHCISQNLVSLALFLVASKFVPGHESALTLY